MQVYVFRVWGNLYCTAYSLCRTQDTQNLKVWYMSMGND